MKVFHIQAAPPLYTNTFLLIGDHGHAVAIDPSANAQQYMDILTRENAVLTAILLTHGHYDHVGAVETLRRATGAQVYMGAEDGAQAEDKRLFPLAQIDHAYVDGETICVDDMHFHVLCTPGHSQGSVCLLCGDLLFSGDTLFCGDTGRTDLSGGSEQQMRHSLARLWDAVPDDTQVLPGHDVFSTMAQEKQTNAYLKAARGSV